MFSFIKKIIAKFSAPKPEGSDGKRRDSAQQGGRPARSERDGSRRRDGGRRDGERRPRREGGERNGEGRREFNREGGRGQGGERRPRREGEERGAREVRRPAAPPKEFPAPVVPESDWDPASFTVPEKEGFKRFQDFALPTPLLHGIADLGFQYCTPIQAASLERTMAGDNVAGRAQTGTGKTAAFLVAALKRMLERPETRPTVTGKPAVLVLAPTRELVVQIIEDAKKLGKHCGLRCLAVYGGCDHEKQQTALESEPMDIIAATPGRLFDFRRSRVIDLSAVHTLVIDEADRMLDMGFIPDVRKIVSYLPKERQTLLFSATLGENVMRLAAQWMPNPVQIAVDPEYCPAETIKQIVYPISSAQKLAVLWNILQRHPEERILIFCNRKSECEKLVRELRGRDLPVAELSGDVDQKKRMRILEEFRAGTIKQVVATDVAARGLQIDEISFVVNYDFPYEPDDYIHRIGRTGRAGEHGVAISFACEDESFIIPDIEKLIGRDLPCQMPDEEMFAPPPEPTHFIPRREHHAPSGGRPGGSFRSGPPRHGPRRTGFRHH